MATKDWKHAGANRWEQNDEFKTTINMIKLDGGKYNVIISWLQVFFGKEKRITTDNTFGNKSFALKFAKSYMRTH